MKDRLLEFLKSENKSSAQLADEIGVQPSGISHILSGRNNPSLDFILKMLEKYQFLSSDWLLFGKGTMYKDKQMKSLFDEMELIDRKPDIGTEMNVSDKQIMKKSPTDNDHTRMDVPGAEKKEKSTLSRIVMFYDDGSFEEYLPKS